jgi:RNA-directed DNA polymerase
MLPPRERHALSLHRERDLSTRQGAGSACHPGARARGAARPADGSSRARRGSGLRMDAPGASPSRARGDRQGGGDGQYVVCSFDTIPHDRLMKAVAERVVDGAMLALVKMFLEAPIVDERDGGRPRRNSRGTPQGGVVSPLLANIYLNLLDRNFRRREQLGQVQGRLVRYADDLVVLAPKQPDATLQWIQVLLQRMGLSLNTEKTKVRYAGQESIDFLSHTHRLWRGKLVLDMADKAHRRTKDELRRITRRTWLSLNALIEELNAYIRGARHYFRRVRRRTLNKLDRFVEQRVARWWSRKHSLPQPAWSLVQKGALWRQHGLERWNLPRHLRPADSTSAM